MTRFAALLRGVNVGGITIKMADLAALVAGLGYSEVRTVLASGNVVFAADEQAEAVKARLEAALRERFGYDAWVHVLALEAVRAIADGFPFTRSPDRHAYVIVAATPEVRAELLAIPLDPAVEQVAEGDGVVYWTVPKGATVETVMGKVQGSAKYKPWVTTRNLNTLEKLLR